MTVRAETATGTRWEGLGAPRHVGMLGILLGGIAVWLTLPPLTQRTLLWPIAVGILAVAAGIWAVTRGARRPGWGAVAAGLAGIGFGILATNSSTSSLHQVFNWTLLFAATLSFATPLTFAAIGGMFSERSGVVNIGLEGMMLNGAFFGIMAADKVDTAWGIGPPYSWLLGLAAAMAAGGLLALIHAFASIHLRADQIVSGTAINFLALGATGYFYIDIYGDKSLANVPGVTNVPLPGIRDIPFIGPVLDGLNLMIWLSFALIVVSYLFMFRTPLGLRIRAVGEHPRAADTVGISVFKTRYAAVTVSGVLAGLGGAYLSLADTHSFNENMTSGRGFIALAALIFGRWRPLGAFAACLLFGFSTALASQLPSISSTDVLFSALPYVITLVAVAGVIGRSIPPAAIGRPYEKQ